MLWGPSICRLVYSIVLGPIAQTSNPCKCKGAYAILWTRCGLTKNHNKGFTIVETLIVLYDNSVIILATSFLVRGQIQRQQYKLGINEQLSLLRDTANDVQTGYYPDVLNLTNVVCAGTASSVNSSNQGQNGDCILVGKRITFNQTNMTIDTLVDGKVKPALRAQQPLLAP